MGDEFGIAGKVEEGAGKSDDEGADKARPWSGKGIEEGVAVTKAEDEVAGLWPGKSIDEGEAKSDCEELEMGLEYIGSKYDSSERVCVVKETRDLRIRENEIMK